MASQRLLPVHGHKTINASDRKNTLLTGPSSTQKGRYKHRKGWSRPAAFGKVKVPSFAVDVVSPPLGRRPEVTVILDFERDGEMMTKNLYGDMFGHIFGPLFDVWS